MYSHMPDICTRVFYPGISVVPGFQQSLDPDPIFPKVEWDPEQFCNESDPDLVI